MVKFVHKDPQQLWQPEQVLYKTKLIYSIKSFVHRVIFAQLVWQDLWLLQANIQNKVTQVQLQVIVHQDIAVQ